MKTVNVLFSGLGGQGVIIASDLFSELLIKRGLDVKKSEIHGMSQRGGSVVSHVRYGSQVHSPVIARGEADYLLSFDVNEGKRYIAELGSKNQKNIFSLTSEELRSLPDTKCANIALLLKATLSMKEIKFSKDEICHMIIAYLPTKLHEKNLSVVALYYK